MGLQHSCTFNFNQQMAKKTSNDRDADFRAAQFRKVRVATSDAVLEYGAMDTSFADMKPSQRRSSSNCSETPKHFVCGVADADSVCGWIYSIVPAMAFSICSGRCALYSLFGMCARSRLTVHYMCARWLLFPLIPCGVSDEIDDLSLASLHTSLHKNI